MCTDGVYGALEENCKTCLRKEKRRSYFRGACCSLQQGPPEWRGRAVAEEGRRSWEGPKPISIVGSTGSIGTQTLDIVAEHPDKFRVVELAAGSNVTHLADQVARHPDAILVVTGIVGLCWFKANWLQLEHAYAKNLACFVGKLRPIGWTISAKKKIEKLLPPGTKYGRGWIGGSEDLHQPNNPYYPLCN